MRRVDKSKFDAEGLDPGDFYFYTAENGQKMFVSCLPNGVGVCIPLRPLLDPKINGGHSWEWDGNEERPTLHPSVNAVGCWHGWIKNGSMVSC